MILFIILVSVVAIFTFYTGKDFYNRTNDINRKGGK